VSPYSFLVIVDAHFVRPAASMLARRSRPSRTVWTTTRSVSCSVSFKARLLGNAIPFSGVVAHPSRLILVALLHAVVTARLLPASKPATPRAQVRSLSFCLRICLMLAGLLASL
jgi:hypothetical protein